MTRDQALTIIENRLGGRSDLRGEIILEMQLAQVQLEQGPEFPWFLETLDETLQNSLGALDTVPLPTDFITEVLEDVVQFLDDSGSWVTLEKADWGDTKRADLRGYVAPTYYSIVGDEIKLAPAPLVVRTFRLRYYGKEAVLSSDLTNAWTDKAPEVLISSTGLVVAGGIADDKSKGRFESSLAIAMERMWAYTDTRKFQGMNTTMQYVTEED